MLFPFKILEIMMIKRGTKNNNQKKDPARLPLTQWKIIENHDADKSIFAKELGIHPLLAKILVNRNFSTVEAARKFLNPSLQDLHNPFLMKDMQKGVDHLIKAVYQNQKIMVYGDYDADGVTSLVLLVKFLRDIHQKVDFYIPSRMDEGYGLNKTVIDQMKQDHVNLIVTVDCGVSESDHIAYARNLGIDTIVLDHHEIPDAMPAAVAVINPKQADCTFPFKHLSAVGIVFNFLIALRSQLRKDGFWSNRPYPNLKQYLDIVALGTIGDIAPLVDENRIFAKFGLDLMTESPRIGIRALKEVSGIESQIIDSTRASFCLIPRINAAGRIASANDAVNLLLSEDIDEARMIAQRLDALNNKRRTMEKEILHEIIEMMNQDKSDQQHSIVFASDKWHPGVIGIVASRLVDRFCRPAVIISMKDGIGKGSGRSIRGFNIYQGLKECESLLLSYGGHRFAAGISIHENNIDEFTLLFGETARNEISEDSLVAETLIDTQCDLNDLSYNFLNEMNSMAPYGSKNPEPVLCIKSASIAAPSVVGNNHLRMRIHKNGTSRNSIWFSKGQLIETLTDQIIDIAFTPQLNYWNGTADVQLKLIDAALPNVSGVPYNSQTIL
ncbi:MAG: single-stranded-DNA-specific exonuclease RecJ [Syntrophobacterales bacterium]|jgi:single-stranded-DNA-specific exonuclease|nr:single-stranded-DNA-specific exonuclease RecJ [Syntrophobacterales bacterium]